jgi:hypothetical protein
MTSADVTVSPDTPVGETAMILRDREISVCVALKASRNRSLLGMAIPSPQRPSTTAPPNLSAARIASRVRLNSYNRGFVFVW